MDFVLPIRVEKDCQYLDKLDETLRNYEKALRELEVNSDAIECVKIINDKILDSIALYYSSQISKAVELIEDIFCCLKEKNGFLTSASKLYSSEETFIGKEIYYKARVGNTNDSFDADNMLHIPFNLRGKVQNQRFSISGCPCIYVGKTSYVTWLELQKPSYNQMFISGCKIDDSISVVNLACTKWWEIKEKRNFDDILIYPMIIATSFVVEEKDRCFHSEYIVSQLFMQVISEAGINGVAYYSKQMEDVDYHTPLNLCIAIIAKYDTREDILTSLKENIIMTNSVNFSEFLSLPYPEKGQPIVGDDSTYNKWMTNFSRINFQYGYSDFYAFDKFILNNFDNLKSEIK